MDAIYNWIMSAPQTVLLSKSIAASFLSNSISGELHSGSFQLIGYRRNNYAGIVAISYWSNRKMLVATIENGEWKTKFEKVVTTSDLTSLFHSSNAIVRDFNEIVSSGPHNQVLSDLSPNGPGFWAYLLVFTFQSNPINITQVAFGYNSGKIAIRHRYQNAWSEWTVK